MSQFMEQFKLYGGDAEGVLERFMDDEELFKVCLEEFFSDNGFEQLQENVLNQSYQTAFENAHALKGVVGNLGVMPIYDKLCVLVETLRSGNCETASEELKAVLEEREAFLQHYANMK